MHGLSVKGTFLKNVFVSKQILALDVLVLVLVSQQISAISGGV
jgi:hypothetical protein